MTSKVKKTLKKQILQAVYEDNVELQHFELGKTTSPPKASGTGDVSGGAVKKGWNQWLLLVLILTFTGGGIGSYSFFTKDPGLIADPLAGDTPAPLSPRVNGEKPQAVAGVPSPDPEHNRSAVVQAGHTSLPLRGQERKMKAKSRGLFLSTDTLKWRPAFLQEAPDSRPFFARVPGNRPPLLVAAETVHAPRVAADSELLPERLLGLVDNQIPLARLFDLQVHTIVIDPGHGGRDPGTIGPKTGLTEKEITLDVARMLKKKLEENSRFRVLLTRDSDKTVSLKERVEFAKEQQADLFVSIHVNSLPSESDDIVETFFFGAQKDARVAMLAAKENRGSEYALGDFTEMIRVLGNTLKIQESRHLAKSVQSNLFSNMKLGNKKMRDAGIKTAPFVVLLGVEVPAILTEIACVSNNQEEKQLSRTGYRQKIADYLELGIREYLEHRVSESTIAKGVQHHGSYQKENKGTELYRN